MVTIVFFIIGLFIGFVREGFSVHVLIYGLVSGLGMAVLLRVKASAHGWPATRSRHGTVFISYRRNYSQQARRIAEALYSEGVGVWMDEYRVILHSTTNLEQMLLDGVRQSSSALIIADGGWENSKWCWEQEGMPIFQMIDSDNITVAAPPGLRLSLSSPEIDVGLAEHLEYVPFDPLAAVITRVAEKAGFGPITQAEEVHLPRRDRFSYHGFDFSLNVAGWTTAITSRKESEYPHRYYERALGSNKLSLGLCCGFLSGRKLLDDVDYGDLPEGRLYYEAIKSVASGYLRVGALDGWKLAGVHLFHFGGRGQLAFTYRKASGWYRRYPINIDWSSGHYEFDFLFIWDGSFQDFCKYAHIMDDMVNTFEYSYK